MPGFFYLGTIYLCYSPEKNGQALYQAEPESAENWIIFWRLFNEVLQAESNTLAMFKNYRNVQTLPQCSNTLAMFNPVGWCVDKEGGIWKALKKVFGEHTIKYRTGSLEKQYMLSIDNFKNALLKISKSGWVFKTLATCWQPDWWLSIQNLSMTKHLLTWPAL